MCGYHKTRLTQVNMRNMLTIFFELLNLHILQRQTNAGDPVDLLLLEKKTRLKLGNLKTNQSPLVKLLSFRHLTSRLICHL